MGYSGTAVEYRSTGYGVYDTGVLLIFSKALRAGSDTEYNGRARIYMGYGVRGTGYGGTGGELGVHGVRGTGYSGRARRRWGTEYGVRRASWAYTEYGVWGTAAGVPRAPGAN